MRQTIKVFPTSLIFLISRNLFLPGHLKAHDFPLFSHNFRPFGEFAFLIARRQSHLCEHTTLVFSCHAANLMSAPSQSRPAIPPRPANLNQIIPQFSRNHHKKKIFSPNIPLPPQNPMLILIKSPPSPSSSIFSLSLLCPLRPFLKSLPTFQVGSRPFALIRG